METKEILTSLEKLNLERIYLLESKEYTDGKRINNLKRAFPFHIFKFIFRHLKNKRIKRKVNSISKYLNIKEVKYADPVNIGLRGTVYTCITNGYDMPKEPLYKDPNLKYIIYTDMAPLQSGIWEYKSINNMKIKCNNNKVNRYYKFHPFELLSEEKFSIYIDGNVELISDTSSLLSIAKEAKTGIAMHKHATMNCAYKNAMWCEINHRGNLEALRRQTARYKEEGFPENFGLLEATIIIVDLNNSTAKKIMDLWWEEFCRTGSGRDQISLPYVLWKCGFSIDDIGCLGNDEYHNPKFKIYSHVGVPF